ncbi:hypothetical protein LEMLEM_LOCUS1304, partial [Lemmus lemmus]
MCHSDWFNGKLNARYLGWISRYRQQSEGGVASRHRGNRHAGREVKATKLAAQRKEIH